MRGNSAYPYRRERDQSTLPLIARKWKEINRETSQGIVGIVDFAPVVAGSSERAAARFSRESGKAW